MGTSQPSHSAMSIEMETLIHIIFVLSQLVQEGVQESYLVNIAVSTFNSVWGVVFAFR
jgi:hypothetical protein